MVASAPFMLFGFLASGLLKVFLPRDFVRKHLGERKVMSIFKAALLGVPLPLCSCSVLPAAAELKRQGARRGAVGAFLVSTPESGIDSIAVTWALLDPIMTVLRPLAAFLTAAATGLGILATENDDQLPPDPCLPDEACSCHDHEHPVEPKASFGSRISDAFRYGFLELVEDIGPWFAGGVLLAGVLQTLLPADLIPKTLGTGMLSILATLAVSVPLYICASASTPVVASLALKGLSPGAALVFLLAGPATNITSLTVIAGILGRKAAAIYLATIVVFSVFLGLAANSFYETLGLDASRWLAGGTKESPGLFSIACGIVLSVLLLRAVALRFLSR
ncbi:MAG: SO_0444 family Cu/Zn efflux transporter [Thermovirgaceae bacterium]